MIKKNDTGPGTARSLIDDFLERTGITGNGGDPSKRYLWTDAFAVQSCFALAHALEEAHYKEKALALIDHVHHHLGKHRPDDHRKGWISGFPEEKGELHPTAGGLRIGKKLPERKPEEGFSESLEWERDGQYYHYLTRWFAALIQAYIETGDKKYAFWAVELIHVSEHFIVKNAGRIRMYWKMSVDLSAPLVESMGAHDPLEGLICSMSALQSAPGKTSELETLLEDMEVLSRGMDWTTSDTLGIGGLLLATARTAELSLAGIGLPSSAMPEKLLNDALNGLKAITVYVYDPMQSAERRLAFRECGMSLGIRVLYGMRERFDELDLEIARLEEYLPLARDIETFWSEPVNQGSGTWQEHLDINAVTLGASLVAKHYPQAFCSAPRKQ